MKNYSLNGKWTGICYNGQESFTFSATVPGCSISDLMACGKLPEDIFWRDHSAQVRQYELCDYDYQTTFVCDPDERVCYFLQFERLDTYCTVLLNDREVATVANGQIAHRFDVTALLRSGENTLRLRFASPITAVASMEPRSGAFTTERMNTRRVQCTYGWDWVDRFVSCGIGGDVELQCYNPDDIRIDGVYVYTKYIDSDSAEIGLDITFDPSFAAGVVQVEILSPKGTVCNRIRRYCNEPFVRLSFDIPKAKLWYPRGYGNQPLYTVVITDENGQSLYREPFGVRTVKIMQIPDKKGTAEYQKCLDIRNPYYDFNDDFSGFILKVNGKKIVCMGANWVPCRPFYCGSTDGKITKNLELAADAGLNMLRVWGGGAFESRHFYRECSRLGIMVTQDFLMACGKYPEEQDWFIEELKKEAEYAAKLIRNQPCLMWWSGDNENAVRGKDTDEDYNGRRAAFFGIAPVLYALDFSRAFLPSSPYGGNNYASNTVGTTHNTQYLGEHIFPYMLEAPCDDYREFWKTLRARFIAEEPQLGAVSYGSLRRFMTDEDIFGDDDTMWNYHTKSNPALPFSLFDLTVIYTQKILGAFTSPEDRYFKMRYLQYEWIRLSMEQLRRELWFSSGLIFWMWNDCWPASSGWSIVDYYSKPKDGYYAFKRCAKPVVISWDKQGDVCRLYASVPGAAVKSAQVTVYEVCGETARRVYSATVPLQKESVTPVAELAYTLPENAVLVADISANGISDRTFYVGGALTLERDAVQWENDPATHTVTVRAKRYIHAVELEADAVFEENCFSLLPGETKRIRYTPITDSAVSCVAYTLKV